MTKHEVLAMCNIGDGALQKLRCRGYNVEIYDHGDPPPKAIIVEQAHSGIDALITTLRDRIDEEVNEREPLSVDPARFDPKVTDRLRLYHHFARGGLDTRLSPDPDVGMAGRCLHGVLDVLEGKYGSEPAVLSYVVNEEALAT